MPPQSSTIIVALLDDHPVLVRGLKNMLETIPWIKVSGAYTNVNACLDDFKNNGTPQVLLMDIHMPDKSGEELAIFIKQNYPQVALIAFTNLEQKYYIYSMLEKGVAGYVIKSSSESILTDAIKEVAAGNTYFDPAIREQAIDSLKRKKNSNSNTLVLTPREKEILQLLAENYNSNDIADRLYISKRTVDFHRANLLLKLDVKNSSTLIKKAIEIGLLH